MLRKKTAAIMIAALAGFGLVAWTSATDGGAAASFTLGAPELESLGALAFGPDDILFVGDTLGAAVYAIEIDDAGHDGAPLNVDNIGDKLAAMFGTSADDITVRDMAVHPRSGNVFLSVARGDGHFGLFKVDGSGAIAEVPLDAVRYSKGAITNAPAADATVRRGTPARQFTITDMAFTDGQVFVAGLSNQEFASNFRRLPFPFSAKMEATSLEIYHVSHGQYETHSPVDTFTPYEMNGSVHVVASYTCTPLVLFNVEGLDDGEHVMGKTVAELGAGNRPLDIMTYTSRGKDHVLVANSRHPLMKVDASSFADASALEAPTRETGVPFEALPQAGVLKLAERGDHIVMLQNADGLHLRSIAKDTL